MTNTTTAAPPSYSLLRAAEAITNWRALAMSGMAGLAIFLTGSLTAYTAAHSMLLGFLLGLVTIVVAMIGYSAVGITLMRHAQGQQIGFLDAILQSTFSVHRFIGVGILLVLGYLAVLLVALAIFFLCKIPGLGPLLYAFAFPLVAVVIGLIGVGMGYVGFPLTAPAIWEGNDTFQTVARLLQIGRQRLMSVIVNMFLLSILVGFLFFVVFGILGSGSMIATGLSTAVGVGPGGGLVSLLGMMGMGGMRGMNMMDTGGYGSSGHLAAFGFGAGLLVMIGLIIPFLTFINGTCLIYLQTSHGMDFSAAEEQLRTKMDEAKRKANEARERAGDRMREAKAAAQAATMPTATPAAEAATPLVTTPALTPVSAPAPAVTLTRTCVKCQAALAADDVFCGECGTKNPV